MEHSSSQKRMIVMMLIIVVLLLGAAYYYIVYPSQNKIHELTSEINTEKTYINIAKTKLNGTNQKDDGAQQEHTVPVGPSTDQLLLDLHEAEKQAKSTIIEFTVNNEDEGGTSLDENSYDGRLQSFSYTMTVQSPDYPSIYEFIHSIENCKRVYVVEELNLPGRVGNENTPFEYKLEVRTYYRAGATD